MDYIWLAFLCLIVLLSSVAYSVLMYLRPIAIVPPESFLSYNQQIEKFVAEGVEKKYQSNVLRTLLA